MLSQLFAIIAPVMITAGLGFVWIKSGRSFDTERMTPVIVAIGTPMMVLSTLLEADIDTQALGQTMLHAAVATITALSIGWAGLKITGQPIKVFLPAMSFPNCGNMGLPLCLFAFGETGLAMAIVFFAVVSTTQFTLGYAIAAGGMNVKKAIRTPLLWSVAVGLVLIWQGWELPLWAMNSIGLIGDMTIPLMLFALGVSLAKLPLGALKRSALLSVARIVGGFAIGLAVVTLFGLEGTARGVILIQCSMPVAVFNFLFAELHNNRPHEVAGTVVISTVISFATLPFLLAYALGG